MSDLRKKIIRLAYQKPELREDLLPLIQKQASYDPRSFALGLSTEEGFRTPLGKLLGMVARYSPSGYQPRNSDEQKRLQDLAAKKLVFFWLGEGYVITDRGRDAIANI